MHICPKCGMFMQKRSDGLIMCPRCLRVFPCPKYSDDKPDAIDQLLSIAHMKGYTA